MASRFSSSPRMAHVYAQRLASRGSARARSVLHGFLQNQWHLSGKGKGMKKLLASNFADTYDMLSSALLGSKDRTLVWDSK